MIIFQIFLKTKFLSNNLIIYFCLAGSEAYQDQDSLDGLSSPGPAPLSSNLQQSSSNHHHQGASKVKPQIMKIIKKRGMGGFDDILIKNIFFVYQKALILHFRPVF